MSVTKRLELYEESFKVGNKIWITKNDLIEIFGENYKEKELPFSEVLYCYFFEEDNLLYYVPISKENNDRFSIRVDVNRKDLYTKINEHFIATLNRRVNNPDLLRFGGSIKKQLKVIEYVLNHPSIRLRYLFIKKK